MPILEISNLQVTYGAVQVLFGVDIQVGDEEIVTIIGPNGAGKSTVIKAVVGLANMSAGSIFFQGRDISHQPAHTMPSLGIGYVPQGRIVFSEMSVLENLQIGAFLLKERHKIDQAVQKVFDSFPRLSERQQQPAGRLSGGEQQMLAIGRALMTDPQLLILDEPSLGLSPKYVDIIFEQLLSLKQHGKTILVVEQNAARALALSDRGYALELGRNRFTDSGDNLLANPDVQRMYLGGG